MLFVWSASPVRAALTNPGFENGLTGWTQIGGASTTTASSLYGGSFQAQISGGTSSNLNAIDTALGLNAGTIAGLHNSQPYFGVNALYQSFSGSIGDTITFHYTLIGGDIYPDGGFYTLSDGGATKTIVELGRGTSLNLSGDVTLNLTSTGTYILGFGAANAVDNIISPTLRIDMAAGPPPEQTSAETTGLPMANVEGQMLINAGSTVTNDINGHLFNLRAGDGEEDANGSIAALMDEGVVVGQGDGSPDAKSPMAQKVLRSRQWEVFTTVNYGNVKLNAINNQAGVQIDAWATSVGIERHLSRGLAVGFAATFLTSDQNYTAGLGRLHLEGPALSAYVSFARKNFWSSLLYSFGTYELDSRRNPGFGFAQAFGTTRTYTNSVQYNTGWNFRFQNNTLVTGPFAGVDYLYGTVNGYSETGGGLAALSFGRQTYQSLVTRVGWSATKKMQTSWAAITPQVRLSYERQNLTNNGTSVSLINAPFTAAGGNQSPGQSYMVAGAGVNFQFNDQLSLLLNYQTQIFRDNMQAHFASVRLGYKF